MACIVCGSVTDEVLGLGGNGVITSLGRIIKATATVSLCKNCAHCQTDIDIDLREYYSSNYKTLSHSADEDDLYSFVDGVKLFRNEHMANVFLEKIESLGLLPLNTKLLDFGCGKSLATRHILNKAVGIDACLYDVSYDYVGFWREFVGPESCACHQLPDDWLERFDVVTSFFSMEHMVDPYSELAKIWGVLKQGGIFYVVIPDMYRDNYADMLVVDHVQHFSESSLVLMLAKAGFELVELDRGSHFQAQILIARKSSSKELMCGVVVEQVLETINRCKKIGEYWRRFGDHLSSFEFDSAKRHENLRYVIIGAGVIGTYIYSLLQFPDRVLCFVDSNEFKQDKGWLDKPVVSAFDLSCFDGEVVYFSGLNPYQEDKYLAGLLPNGCISSKIFTTKSIEV